jgi:hypothetical protein
MRLDYFEHDEVVDFITQPAITFAWGCVRSALELLAGLDPPLLVVPKPRLFSVTDPVDDDNPGSDVPAPRACCNNTLTVYKLEHFQLSKLESQGLLLFLVPQSCPA